jgi:hypothetical protein
MEFEEFWEKLTEIMSEKQEIHNWTVDKEFLGKGDFTAIIKRNYVECDVPNAKMLQQVPKIDFQIMFEKWNTYLNGKIHRSELRNQSRFTKYTISIIHQYENLMK